LPQKFEEKSTIQQAQGAARPIHSWPGETAKHVATYFDQVLDALLLDLNTNIFDEVDEHSKRTRRQKKRIRTARGKKARGLLQEPQLDEIEKIDSRSVEVASQGELPPEAVAFEELIAEAASQVKPDGASNAKEDRR
jgi:hypothetical protein